MSGVRQEFAGDLRAIDWHVKGSYADDACKFAASLAAGSKNVVKRNVRRTVYRLATGDASYFLKHDHPCHLRDVLKGLWRCKCKAEFLAGEALARANVPVVDVVGWGRRGTDSFLLSRELRDAVDGLAAWQRCRTCPNLRQRFLQGLAEFLRRMMEARIRHPDLHLGNVLAVITEQAVAFHLVDVYGVVLGAGAVEPHRSPLLSLAYGLARDITSDEAEALLRAVFAETCPTDAGSVWRQGVQRFFRGRRRAWAGRRKRLLASSSLCARHVSPEGVWLLRKPFTVHCAQRAYGAHLVNVDTGQSMVKIDTKRQLSRVVVDDRSFVVKEFRTPARIAAFAPDRASWLNAYRLELAHVPCAACFAWLRTRDGRGFLVLEDLGEMTLLQRLADGAPEEEVTQLMDAAARLTAWIHGAGIAPGDLNPANMMLAVKPLFAGMPLTLVDFDRMKTSRGEVSLVRRRRNLEQLFELLAPLVPRHCLVHAIDTYCREFGFGGREQAFLKTCLPALP